MFRLKSLYIKDYKNIHEQTFDFSTNTGYIALIGLNGSGKSNLLEAIALIFEGILFTHRAVNFHYEIKYEIGNVEYIRRNRFASRDGARISERDMVYPTSIIACYSGEDRRLWHTAFEKYYMQYFKKAVRNRTFSPQIMYIDKYCWKIAFIALLCSNNADILQFLRECCHFNNIDEISIKFNTDPAKERTFIHHAASRWYHALEQNADAYGNINANTIVSTDMTTYGARNSVAPNYIFQFLYLLALPKKNKEKRQTIDKLITDIDIEINGLNFDGLSEGEKKMILVTCITQILGNDNSLVLLDEPDAHVHIENKKEILKTIEQYNGQTIFTTHSPIFTALMSYSNIYPIDKGNAINESQRDLIVKMANNNINYIDGACIIASKYLVITEGPGDINYLKAAIQACGNDESQYKVLEEVSFVYAGGAKLVEEFYNEILSNLYATLKEIVFVFDLDSEGREGAKQVQKLIDSGLNKIKIIYYNNNYPIVDPNNTDFYLEDIFSRNVYNIVQLPTIGGEPTYAQLKKGGTLANSIKSKIAELYKKKLLRDEDYFPFKPFLRQLKSELGL